MKVMIFECFDFTNKLVTEERLALKCWLLEIESFYETLYF